MGWVTMQQKIVDFPVPLIFKKILKETLSGTIEIKNRDHVRHLTFIDGKLAAAHSTVFNDQIGVILHLTGKINQDQYDFISGLAQSADQVVGDILVQNHFISEGELQKAIVYKTRHVALSVFSLESGEWELRQELPELDSRQILSIPIPGIIYEGGRRDEIVHFCKRRYYFFTPVPGDIPEPLRHLFTDREMQLYQNLKQSQKQNNDEIIAKYNLSPDFYWQVISVFWLFGIVDFAQPEVQYNIEDDLVKLIKLREKIEGKNLNEFEILGLSEDITLDRLEAAFYALTQRFSPDRFGSAFAPEIKKSAKFVSEKITWAYKKIKVKLEQAIKEIKETPQKVDIQPEVGKPEPPKQAKEEDQDEESSENLFIKAKGYYQQKKYDEAVTILKNLVQHAPSNGEFHYYLGLSQTPLEYFQIEAENHLKKAVELEPWNPEPVYALGVLFKQVKKVKLAEKCFQRTLLINPGFRKGGEALKELRQPKKKKESIFKKKIF
jgi:tetratricopeptide (TPR) repeat protein